MRRIASSSLIDESDNDTRTTTILPRQVFDTILQPDILVHALHTKFAFHENRHASLPDAYFHTHVHVLLQCIALVALTQ